MADLGSSATNRHSWFLTPTTTGTLSCHLRKGVQGYCRSFQTQKLNRFPSPWAFYLVELSSSIGSVCDVAPVVVACESLFQQRIGPVLTSFWQTRPICQTIGARLPQPRGCSNPCNHKHWFHITPSTAHSIRKRCPGHDCGFSSCICCLQVF